MSEHLDKRLKELEAEYKKGIEQINLTQATVLRIEGAIAFIRQELSETKAKEIKDGDNSHNSGGE